MKNSQPDPKTIHPVLNYYDLVYAKPLNKFKNVEIGEFTYIHESTFGKQIEGLAKSPKDKLIIGKFCQIGKNVKFLLSGVNHKKDCISTYPFYMLQGWNEKLKNNNITSSNTIIGNDVWIGDNVVILPGVKIGNGVIIGYGSIVTKSIPDYCIVAGNPARIKSKRFDDKTIKLLNQIKWWDLPIDTIRKIIPSLTNNNIKQALKILLSLKHDKK